ncbi:uncharacterized protein K02A2.6-like [Dermacentor silvarum]|uniref:uncharacterized protein K02A2.6-like n=1 Tax=Dermacentor silvarum TaxID=543639 RepID=UPI001899501E|nr:uncharacterized protein K02A2.6-like [Dermacentor silvarum]
MPLPERPWQKLAVDIVGPMERAPHDCRYANTLIDYFSKWPEVQFCSEVSSRAVINLLLSMFSREGYPEVVVCDNGPQFSFVEFIEFLKDPAISLAHSSVYYPQANGLVERFNRVFKNFAQVAMLEQHPLPQAVTEYFGIYRCTPHATTGVAPSVLLHGRRPRTRLDVVGLPSPVFFSDPVSELHRLRQRVKSRQYYSKEYTDRHRASKKTTVSVGDYVRIKKPGISVKGDLTFSQPGKVVRQQGPSSFRLDDGRTWDAWKLSRVPAASAKWNLQHNAVSEPATPPSASQQSNEYASTTLPEASPATPTLRAPAPAVSEDPVFQRRVQPPRNRRPPDRYRDHMQLVC